MRRIFLLIALLAFTSAYAEEEKTIYKFEGDNYTISYEENDDKQTISLNGNLLSSLVDDHTGINYVRKNLTAGKDVIINLDSGGGFFMVFDKLRKSILKACDPQSNCKITTVVARSCESACIPFFMLGEDRIAHKNAVFGFHQAALIPGKFKLGGMAQMDLKRKGVDATWLKENSYLFDSLTITKLKPEELEGSNIVTEIR
jgi:hypothetical protein